MQYRVVFIDWDGTLSRSRFWERWSKDPEYSSKYELLQDALFTSEQGKEILKDWMTGAKSYHEVIECVSGITGISQNILEKELKYSAENMKLFDTTALDIIVKIRGRGIKVVIATDNMDTFSKWTVPAMNLNTYFDDILISNIRSATKTQIIPDGRSLFFSDYLLKHNIKEGQSVLIDDNVSTKVLEQCGIDFLHVTDTEPLTFHLKCILDGIR